MTRRVRHVVLAAGLQPRLPAQVRPGPRVWHSSEHLFRADSLDPRCVRDVVVVGGGQSAAEVVLHLRGLLGDDARVHAVHGRFGYSPADSSPYVNRIFDAESVDALFDAPESQRSRQTRMGVARAFFSRLYLKKNSTGPCRGHIFGVDARNPPGISRQLSRRQIWVRFHLTS